MSGRRVDATRNREGYVLHECGSKYLDLAHYCFNCGKPISPSRANSGADGRKSGLGAVESANGNGWGQVDREPMVGADEAAEFLGFPSLTVRRMAHAGRLPTYKFPMGSKGRTLVKFRISELKKYLSQLKDGPGRKEDGSAISNPEHRVVERGPEKGERAGPRRPNFRKKVSKP